VQYQPLQLNLPTFAEIDFEHPLLKTILWLFEENIWTLDVPISIKYKLDLRFKRVEKPSHSTRKRDEPLPYQQGV
jgi:hypothetical protein